MRPAPGVRELPCPRHVGCSQVDKTCWHQAVSIQQPGLLWLCILTGPRPARRRAGGGGQPPASQTQGPGLGCGGEPAVPTALCCRCRGVRLGGQSCFVSVTLIRQFGAASECKSLGAVSSRAFKWKDGRGGRESHGGCRSSGVGAVFMRGISLWCFMARKMLFSPGLFD